MTVDLTDPFSQRGRAGVGFGVDPGSRGPLAAYAMGPRVNPASADRYAPPAVWTPAPARASSASMTEEETRNWMADVELANEDDRSAAHIVVNELPDLQMRSRRAIMDGDQKALLKVMDRVKKIREDYGDALKPWMNINNAGEAGARASALVRDVMFGDFAKSEAWGGTPPGEEGVSLTPDAYLYSQSPERKAQKARRVATDLAVDSGTARAIVDQDDPRHVIYGMFDGMQRGAGPGQLPADFNRKSAYLQSVSRLEKTHLPAFGSNADFAEFVKAFDDEASTNKYAASDRFMTALADAYVGQTGPENRRLRPGDLVRGYSGLVKELTAVGAPAKGGTTQPGAPADPLVQAHMSKMEAQEYAAAFIREASRLGVPDNLASAGYRDALASAVKTVRVAQDVYGIDFRKGGLDTSTTVAQLALSRVNVPGANAGSRFDALKTVSSRVERLLSPRTREEVDVASREGGGVYDRVVEKASPFSAIELDIVGKVAPVLWKHVTAETGSANEVFGQLSSSGSVVRNEAVQGAVAALQTHFPGVDLRVLGEVAGDLVGNLAGGDDDGRRVTLEDSLRRHSNFDLAGKFGKPDNPVPVERRISKEGNGFTDADKALLVKGTAVASTDKDRPAVETAQRYLARGLALKDSKDVHDRAKSAVYEGKFYVTVAGGEDDCLMGSGGLAFLSDPRHSTSDAIAAGYMEEGLARDLHSVKITAADRGKTTAERAEALVKLLLASHNDMRTLAYFDEEKNIVLLEPSKLPFSSHVGVLGVALTSDSKVRRITNLRSEWDNIRDSAFDLGVALPATWHEFHETGVETYTKKFSELVKDSDSPFVRSGYYNPKTGKLDVKNMVRTMQNRTYSSPAANPDLSGSGELSEAAKACRRMLALVETEQTATGSAVAAVRRHYLAQGITDRDALASAVAATSGRMAAAWRRGGLAEVEREKREVESLKPRYLPVWNEDVDRVTGNSVFRLDNDRVIRTVPMSDSKWEVYRKKYKEAQESRSKASIDDSLFAQYEALGPEMWRRWHDFSEKMMLRNTGGGSSRQAPER